MLHIYSMYNYSSSSFLLKIKGQTQWQLFPPLLLVPCSSSVIRYHETCPFFDNAIVFLVYVSASFQWHDREGLQCTRCLPSLCDHSISASFSVCDAKEVQLYLVILDHIVQLTLSILLYRVTLLHSMYTVIKKLMCNLAHHYAAD